MTLNVLAIDDSRTIRTLLNAALEGAGFQTCLAEDGQKGLEQLNHFAPDVVITDINMPVLDGFGVIEGVRRHAHFGTIPILVLTTESAPDLKKRARDAGATGWIVKPFNSEKLTTAIKRVTA